MRVVVALGGNALLQRGEPMTARAQRTNVRIAAKALADLARDHQIIVAHGNGPQVGLLALQGAAYDPNEPWPLDVLGAETEGMIGYLIEQELMNALPAGSHCTTLLTRVEVDPGDPAFDSPTKPIGPVYSQAEAAQAVRDHHWAMVTEATGGLRRVVPSPLPMRIIGIEAIRVLLDAGQAVICAGGGGIPVARNAVGEMSGVEAVIDKDRTAALLATELQADALLLLTNVEAVFHNFGKSDQRALDTTSPNALEAFEFAPGSMGPKVSAAAAFVRASGRRAGIGTLAEARAILEGRAGTTVLPDVDKYGKPPIFRHKTSGFTGADQSVSVWADDGGVIV
jgi:carbamate kinase